MQNVSSSQMNTELSAYSNLQTISLNISAYFIFASGNNYYFHESEGRLVFLGIESQLACKCMVMETIALILKIQEHVFSFYL